MLTHIAGVPQEDCPIGQVDAVLEAKQATVTGAVLFVVMPFSSLSPWFTPQQRTVPSLRRAQVCWEPAEISTAMLSPMTVTGAVLFVLLPFPSAPPMFDPQQRTVPSIRRAQV